MNDDDDGRPLPAEPTNDLPGTLEKLLVMAERARRGERLFHPDDAKRNDRTPCNIAEYLNSISPIDERDERG